jgi:predicted Zn-dependent peptidase
MDTSSFAERILPNGLRTVAIGRPGTSTVASTLLFLKAGSHHEGDYFGPLCPAVIGPLGDESRS